MAADRNHPACPQPPRPEVRVWRYMDFAKYVSILDTSCLYFARSDRLGDPFEGSYPRSNVADRSRRYQDVPEADRVDRLADISGLLKWMREWTYVSCWHMNEHESAAMWKLYAKSNEAVAIVSSYDRLAECLPNSVSIGAVKYIDYELERLPEEGKLLHSFMHKRRSFEHEHEARAFVQELPKVNGIGALQTELRNSELGLPVAIKPACLIESVYVAPTTPDWFCDLVKRVSKRYGQGFPVRRSSLDAEPMY